MGQLWKQASLGRYNVFCLCQQNVGATQDARFLGLEGDVRWGCSSFKLCAFFYLFNSLFFYLRCFKSIFGVQLLFCRVGLLGKGAERRLLLSCKKWMSAQPSTMGHDRGCEPSVQAVPGSSVLGCPEGDVYVLFLKTTFKDSIAWMLICSWFLPSVLPIESGKLFSLTWQRNVNMSRYNKTWIILS